MSGLFTLKSASHLKCHRLGFNLLSAVIIPTNTVTYKGYKQMFCGVGCFWYWYRRVTFLDGVEQRPSYAESV
jgi:hypothetical protein